MFRKLFVAAAALLFLAGCAGTPRTESSAPAAASEPRGVTLPEFETVKLANGMEILLMGKHDVPMVSFRAVIRGGAVADPERRNGTAALLADLMRKGAGKRDAAEFARAVESVGGALDTGADKEALVVDGEFMSRDADLMIELLGDVLIDPVLARGEFDKLKERSIQQIQSMKDTNLRGLTSVYGDAFLFAGHPYGNPVIGSEAGLATTGYPDVRRYFIEHVGADRTVLAVVGDFDAADMRAKLERRFSGWRQAQGKPVNVEAMPQLQGNRVLLVDKADATQTYFYIGNVGIARDYEDRAALDLVNTVFGGRFTSMLNTKLRVESGLTYGAGSRLDRNVEPGSLAITSFTQTGTTTEAIDLALATLETLHTEGLTQQQLDSAKAYVLGQFPPRLETAGGIAARLADLRFYGLDRGDVDEYAEKIAAVTLEDARQIIDEVYPKQGNLTYVLIGNAAAIRDSIAKHGPVTEMRINSANFTPEND